MCVCVCVCVFAMSALSLSLQDLLEFTETCLSVSTGEPSARDQLVQVALHLLTQHTTGTTLTTHLLTYW